MLATKSIHVSNRTGNLTKKFFELMAYNYRRVMTSMISKQNTWL